MDQCVSGSDSWIFRAEHPESESADYNTTVLCIYGNGRWYCELL